MAAEFIKAMKKDSKTVKLPEEKAILLGKL